MSLSPAPARAVLRWALPAGVLVTGAVLTARQRRAAEAARAEMERRLREADRLQGDFVTTVSHELRTPLTSIIGYAELLLSDNSEVPAVHRQVLGRIERNARRLSGLVEDLITMAQVEEGGLQLTRVPLDLREPARAAAEAAAGPLATKELTLSTELGDAPVVVAGDAAKLERVVIHLLANAVKFSHVGDTVALRLAVEDGQAALRVVDTGVGISPEEQQRLGERFFRGADAQERVVPGAGLGLAVTRAIVDAHRGTVDVLSQPGRGSTFTIRVPVLPR